MSIDPPENNAAMVEKLELPFPLLSDPRGDLARRYGLWDEKENVAVPAIVVVSGGGVIRYFYAGDDFADRPGDDLIFEALKSADEEPFGSASAGEDAVVRVPAEEAESSSLRPDRPAMTLDQLFVYYRGVFFATVALRKRFGAWGAEGREAFKEVGEYQRMARGYSDAIKETRKLKKGH